MEHKYLVRNKVYSVVSCTHSDIPSHVEKVCRYWVDINIEDRIEQLHQTVDRGNAYKVCNYKDQQTCAIYYLDVPNTDGHKVIGLLFWSADNRSMAVLAHAIKSYTPIRYIYFMPHSCHFHKLVPFEKIVTDSSIRLFHSHHAPLCINLYTDRKFTNFLHKQDTLNNIEGI